MKSRILLLLAACNLAGCYKNHFYVQHETVDRNFLASSHVHTPDPRQENPPQGQRLLVSWDFPRSVFKQKLTLLLTVRFWDDTQETIKQPIQRRRDFAVFYFPNQREGKDKRILTYRVEALNANGSQAGLWEHQFWTKLIDVGASLSDAQRMSSSVSSQERQGSVTEMP